MPESDELASAFVELEVLVRERSRLPGLAAAQSEARRRRGRRVAWVAAGVVVLVLAGVATAVPGWLRRSGPPVVEPPSVTGDPSASATGPTPRPSPSVTSAPRSLPVLANMTPPPHIRDASLDVPEFDLAGCHSGLIKFLDGVFDPANGGLLMDLAAVGDVDADGREEVLVAVRCAVPVGMHSVSETQVLAYSGPGLALLGPVAVVGDETLVRSLLVGPDGYVQLGTAQSGTTPPDEAVAFDRYQWIDSGFELTEHVDVSPDALPGAVLSAESTSLQLTADGSAEALVVTIRNDGPAAAWPLSVSIYAFAPVSIEVEGFIASAAAQQQILLVAAPGAGETVTLPLRVAVLAGATLAPDSSIVVSVSGQQIIGNTSNFVEIALQPA